MINNISLAGFKSYSDLVQADLDELLVIAGPNSSGKTTLIQAILLLSQTLRNPRRDVVLDLAGDYVQFTEFRDAVFGKPKKGATFNIGFNLTLSETNVFAHLEQNQLYANQLLTIGDSLFRRSSVDEDIEDITVMRRADVQLHFSSINSRPVVQKLFLEKEVTDFLTVRHELERAGRNYRVTVQSILKSGTVIPTLEDLHRELDTLYELTNQVFEQSRNTKSRVLIGRGLLPTLNRLLTQYGFSLDDPNDSWSVDLQKEIKNIRLPRLDRLSEKNTKGKSLLITQSLAKLVQDWIKLSASKQQSSVMTLPIVFDHFLPTYLSTSIYEGDDDRLNNYLSKLNSVFGKMLRELKQYISNIHYVGPLRARPERVYIAAGTPIDVGKSGENAVPLLWLEQNIKVTTKTKLHQEPSEKRLGKAVGEWFEEFGIAHALHVTRPKRIIYQVELDGPQESRTRVTIADVGFGVSQLVPIIVAGLRATKGSTVIFEQPEIHLHPKMQAKLADFFICLIDLGKKVIVETHSEHLVNMLRLHIAEDEFGLLKDRIKILFVQSHSTRATNDRNGKGAYITNLQVDEFGQIENWPADFFAEQGDLNERLLKAIMSKHSQNISK